MKAIKSITKEESKSKYKGKTTTLKESDTPERFIEISKSVETGKLKLLYYFDDGQSNWVYDKL